ncbi:MAG: hypothetical protein AAF235_05450 [Planctomycetota bacterium]
MTDGILRHTVGDSEGIGFGADGISRVACDPPCCTQAGSYYKAVNCFDPADEVYIPTGSSCADQSTLTQSIIRVAGVCYTVDDTVVLAADLPADAVTLTEQAFDCFASCVDCDYVYRLDPCPGNEPRYVRQSVLEQWLIDSPDVFQPTDFSCQVADVLGSCVSFRLDRMNGPGPRQPGMKFATSIPGSLNKWCCECEEDCAQQDSRVRGCRSSCDPETQNQVDTFTQCNRRRCRIIVDVQASVQVRRELDTLSGSASGQRIWDIGDDLSQTLVQNSMTASGVCLASGTGLGSVTDFFGGGVLTNVRLGISDPLAGPPGDICEVIRELNGGTSDCPNPCIPGLGTGCGTRTVNYSGDELFGYERLDVSSTASFADSCEGVTVAWNVTTDGDYQTGQGLVGVGGTATGSYSVRVVRDGGSPQDCPPVTQPAAGVFSPWGYV